MVCVFRYSSLGLGGANVASRLLIRSLCAGSGDVLARACALNVPSDQLETGYMVETSHQLL